MREIKFRAWDKRRNIYGKVVSIDMDDSDWFKDRHAGHSGRVSLENPKNEKDCGVWGSWIEFVDIEQFTGLYDKSGKEIYEGDIIDGLVVTYCANSKDGLGMQAGWYIQRGDFESWAPLESRCNENGDNWIVEGNIHENPELVKA